MKKTIYLIVLVATLFSFGKKHDFNLVPLENGLLVDATEISNIDWREYRYWNKNVYGIESPEYKACLPDTTVWRQEGVSNEPYVAYYFQHPAYGEYPVVGISYEQALAFCQWRSNRVNEYIYIQKNNIKPGGKPVEGFPVIYTFRLPTKKEWLHFSKADLEKRAKKTITKKLPNSYRVISGQMIFGNFNTNLPIAPKAPDTLNNNKDITAPVNSYFPNTYAIYNTFGNVAEMTSEKGKAMGGHYQENLDNLELEKEYLYTKPTCWLGFRCVAEKNEELNQ